MSEWSTVALKDIAEINPRESIKKGDIAVKVAMDKLQPFCRDIPEIEYEVFSGGTKFRNGDTIMARITPCLENGKTAMVNVLDDGQVGFGSTEYIVFRAKKGISDPYFLYYLVCSPMVREPAIKSMVGSSGRQRVQTDVVQNLVLSVPSLPEQVKIGEFLKKIDDKIAVNNKINRNLSEQAFAIFEEEYQSFSTAKIGELPIVVTDYVANGSFKSLKDNVTILEEKEYAYFIRNVDLKAKTFPRFVNQHSYEFLRKSRLEGGEVIISNVGDVGSVFLCPVLDGPMTLGNNMIMLNTEKHNSYLYLYFKSHIGQGMIAGITGGSAQPKFNKTDFKSLEIKYPNDDQVEAFNRKVKNLLDMIEKNDQENKKLEELRDRLLPKLMSGELDVSELEI